VTKQEFIDELRKKISGLPEKDIEERINFYSEMIDDRVEEGLSEEDAVSEIGSVDKIAEQIIADTPLTKIAKERVKPKREFAVWEIVLLILGAPIWLSLAVAALSVILSLYIVLLSVIVSVWAVFASLVGCVIGGALSGGVLIFNGHILVGITVISLALVCAGLAIFLFFGCTAATKGIVLLTKKIALGIKKCFVKRRNA